MSKRIKVIFILSILCNVLLLGLVGGHAIKRAMWHENKHTTMDALFEYVPEEKRAQLKAEWDALRQQKGSGKRKEMHALHSELDRLLRAETFDADAYKNAVMRMRLHRHAKGQEFMEMMIRLAEVMPLEGRIAMADMMKRGKRHGKHRKE